MAHSYKTVTQLFSQSKDAVKNNLQLFILLNVLTILSTAWTVGTDLHNIVKGDAVNTAFDNYWHSDKSIRAGLIGIALSVLATIILYMLGLILSVKAAKGKHVPFTDVWQSFKKLWWKILLVEALFILAVIAGLILLLVPGLYLIGRLGLAPFIVVDQNTSVTGALAKSWAMTKKRAWPVFVAIFFTIILNIPSLVPVIGPIVAVALTIAYSCGAPIRYFELKGAKNG